jgi:hypothetical protein
LEDKAMANVRIRAAAGLMIAVLSVLGAASALAATATKPIRYVCESAPELLVMRTANKASVHFGTKTYDLRREASSIGAKYISRNAALIVDGRSAVFVSDDQLQLGTCLQASRMSFAK